MSPIAQRLATIRVATCSALYIPVNMGRTKTLSAKQMLAIVSITACLFFSLIRSGAIIDAIEHSGPTASGHSHSAISLATLDIDHDDHDVAAHQESEGDNPSDNDGDGSSNDAVHHHHHQDGSAGILSIGSPLTGDALVQFMANGSPEPRFSVFGPHDRLKRPPKASQILA